MAVEFVTESCIYTRHTIVRLRNVYVQQGIVDTLCEETVATLFDDSRIAGIRISGAGIRFCRNSAFAVDVAAGGGSAVFDVADRPHNRKRLYRQPYDAHPTRSGRIPLRYLRQRRCKPEDRESDRNRNGS